MSGGGQTTKPQSQPKPPQLPHPDRPPPTATTVSLSAIGGPELLLCQNNLTQTVIAVLHQVSRPTVPRIYGS